ncbi:MAG: UDP-N-acetylmuramate dehydrogenase [Clostridiales bacterium]|nr:UDP-N-acetylmuramate dehydrogenase [Clostridiales bacterium]
MEVNLKDTDLFEKELNEIFSSDRILKNEPMSRHTSLRIGGNTDYMVFPATIDEIRLTIKLCRKYDMPYYIMGNGSNLLVSDSGYRGLIIKLSDRFSNISVEEDGTVLAQAGVLMSKLSNVIAANSLTGFEFGAGIPGTLGGAVAMNAGAYGGEMQQVVISATVIDGDGNIRTLSNKELEFGYRSSVIQKKDLCVLEATLKLNKGDKRQILDKIRELNHLRQLKQPLDKFSAGSTFKRPEGHFAGKLISDAGLRGFQIGDAAVSEKHCGFLVNKGNATAGDFMKLIKEVTRIVNEKYGVLLEPEVKFLGTFDSD